MTSMGMSGVRGEQIRTAVGLDGVEQFTDDSPDRFAQLLDPAGGERLDPEAAHPGVVRGIHGEQVGVQGGRQGEAAVVARGGVALVQ
jgi:hypothetical protein